MKPMAYINLVYIIEVFLLVIIGLQAGKVQYINRSIQRSFLGIVAALIIWSFCVFMMSVSDSLQSIWFWHEVKFLGITLLPNFFLLFAVHYSKREKYNTGLLKIFLFSISFATLLTIATNPMTHLFRLSHNIVIDQGMISVYTENGPMFWVFTAYTYLVLSGVFILISIRYRELPKDYKTQPMLMLIALLIQAVINLSFVFGILPDHHDPSPFTLGMTAVIFYWGLFHSVIPDLVPVARSLVFESVHVMLLVVDVNGYIVDYNQAMADTLRRNNLNISGVHYDDVTKQLIEATRAKLTKRDKRTIYKIPDGAGSRYFDVNNTPIIHKGEQTGRVISIEEITEVMNYLDKLEQIALIDSLTNLNNRIHYDKMIREWDLKHESQVSIVYGGLNNFKLINESFGGTIGDQVLKNVAQTIIEMTPEKGFVARTGGDEFAMIIPDMTEEEANLFREKVEKGVNGIEIKNTNISITLACDTYDGTQETLAEVAQNALNKMYRKKLNESQSSRSAMINSLKIALEQSNYETKAHADRTEELALAIGKRLGLSDSHLNDLSMLSSLHDLGKIAIPDYILDKPGKLTDEEFEIIKTHPQKGYVMAIASPELVHIADGILHHHERWDGKGYPHGLKGEEISIEARIICIVDAYDVMTNARSYKSAMTVDEAVAELKRCKGTQFDPSLVDVLIEVVQNE
jgi:diguanylate cyclase (GGDEF)-like protein/PAS domain S-box-containing protein